MKIKRFGQRATLIENTKRSDISGVPGGAENQTREVDLLLAVTMRASTCGNNSLSDFSAGRARAVDIPLKNQP